MFATGTPQRVRYFTVLAAPHPGGPRLGMVVGRRASKRAVVRNRVRRLARELFRHAGLPPLDVVVIARPGLDSVSSTTLREDLRTALGELKQRCVQS